MTALCYNKNQYKKMFFCDVNFFTAMDIMISISHWTETSIYCFSWSLYGNGLIDPLDPIWITFDVYRAWFVRFLPWKHFQTLSFLLFQYGRWLMMIMMLVYWNKSVVQSTVPYVTRHLVRLQHNELLQNIGILWLTTIWNYVSHFNKRVTIG